MALQSNEVVYNDEQWTIYSKSQLLADYNLDGLVTPLWQQTKSISSILLDVLDDDYVECDKGETFKLDRLSKCVAVGDVNGNILFVDVADGGSMWCIYYDDADVEFICSSIDIFISEAKSL